MTEPILRDARPDDGEALAALAVRAYAAAFRTHLPPAVLAGCDAAFFRARFAREGPAVRLAESGGVPVGFGCVTGAQLAMLFVDPDRTGGGLGARLLADAERRGAAVLECFRDNAGARRFYERHGWRWTDTYERPFLGVSGTFCRYAKGLAGGALSPVPGSSSAGEWPGDVPGRSTDQRR